MNNQSISRRNNYYKRCEEKFSHIDLEEFIEFYNKHTDKEIKEKFNLTKNELALFVKNNNITKVERFKYLSMKTRQEKYGNPTYRNIDKARETRLNKYGDENYNNGTKISQTRLSFSEDKKNEINEKRIQTCLDRFGCKFASQSEEVKQKVRETCMEKYGVPYYCMSEDCRKTGFNNSKPNNEFEDFLSRRGIKYKREFYIHHLSYDFLLIDLDICVEINPFPYHNSTFAPHDVPKDKYYHQKKSINCVENGYKCLHIFDWEFSEKDFEYKLDKIKKSKSYHIDEPNAYIFDLQTKKLVEEMTESSVVIYDDGFKYE